MEVDLHSAPSLCLLFQSEIRNQKSAILCDPVTFRLCDVPWFVFRNDAGELVPAFGVVRLTGVVVLEQARVVLTGAKPNAFGCQYQCAINGPTPVAAGKFGVCTQQGAVPALFEVSDGTPAAGERWGPRDAGWKLRKNTGGFAVVGVTNSGASGPALVLVQPAPMLAFVGKTDASHAKSSTGTISIYAGTLGSESDTGVNMTGVFNRFADVDSGKWVRCEWNPSSPGSDWELTAAEC